MIHRRNLGQAVLIVEDDPTLRMLAAGFFDDAGFEALEAPDANAAIEVLENRPDIRLMFTDIEMPGGPDGLDLANRVRDRWPPIEIAVTSGRAVPDSGALPDGVIFIPKPYVLSRVVERFRELMH